MQHTVLHPVSLSGIGLHSGAETTLRILPADAQAGITFVRTDVTDRDNRIPARYDHVVDTRLCTVLGNGSGVTVGTVEHLMAGLAACGIDNAIVMLDGPEVPIMDGSAEPFISAIQAVGLKTQAAPRRGIKILRPVTVMDGDKSVTLSPGIGSRFRMAIDFAHPAIGAQSYEIDMFGGQFAQDVADSRTFGFLHEVAALRAQGLALGGSLENAIVLDQHHVLNADGLRHKDEFARHKVLDAVGDLYLGGGPIIGIYDGIKAGHALNNNILRALFAERGAWTYVDLFIDFGLVGSVPVVVPAASASSALYA